MLSWPVAVAVGALVLIELIIGRLTFLQGVPRSRWLSFTGGISVAYVFVSLIPELITGQEEVMKVATGPLAAIDKHMFILAMLGVVLFYWIERMVQAQKSGQDVPLIDERRAFMAQTASFSLYALIVSYAILPREGGDLVKLTALSATIALHFVGASFGRRDDFPGLYDRYGRYVTSVALVVGLALAAFNEPRALLSYLLIAFFAGGVILNVLKEELPEARQARVAPFAVGALLFTGILLVL